MKKQINGTKVKNKKRDPHELTVERSLIILVDQYKV
jgi:hypothetical protein